MGAKFAFPSGAPKSEPVANRVGILTKKEGALFLISLIAQQVERETVNLEAVGSPPLGEFMNGDGNVSGMTHRDDLPFKPTLKFPNEF